VDADSLPLRWYFLPKIVSTTISLRLGAEYIGVHDLEGKEPLLQGYKYG